MTREEKISRLKDILSEINENENAVCYLTSEDNELIESAIEALEQEPYNTSEWCHDCKEYDQDKHCCPRYNKVIRNTVEEMKESKIGHWKKMVSVYDIIEGKYRMIPYTRKDEELSNPPFYVCDCGNNSKKPTNYCPDCGAKMINVPDINDGNMSEIPTGSEPQESEET